MTPKIEDIKAEIENALNALLGQEDVAFIKHVRSILLTNLDRNRPQRFIEGDIRAVRDYVQRVIDGYQKYEYFIHRLLNEQAVEEWAPLAEKIERWAFWFLVHSGYQADLYTQEIAKECTNEAAIQILHAYFPYDTDFNPWARIIVNNTCRKYFRDKAKKSEVQEHQLVDIETVEHLLEAPAYDDRRHQYEDILEAVNSLSDLRRAVIMMTYFDEMSASEIAEKLGKNVSSIYSLRFYAIEELKKILDRNGNNVNE